MKSSLLYALPAFISAVHAAAVAIRDSPIPNSGPCVISIQVGVCTNPDNCTNVVTITGDCSQVVGNSSSIHCGFDAQPSMGTVADGGNVSGVKCVPRGTQRDHDHDHDQHQYPHPHPHPYTNPDPSRYGHGGDRPHHTPVNEWDTEWKHRWANKYGRPIPPFAENPSPGPPSIAIEPPYPEPDPHTEEPPPSTASPVPDPFGIDTVD